jgi:hypothetical protein
VADGGLLRCRQLDEEAREGDGGSASFKKGRKRREREKGGAVAAVPVLTGVGAGALVLMGSVAWSRGGQPGVVPYGERVG